MLKADKLFPDLPKVDWQQIDLDMTVRLFGSPNQKNPFFYKNPVKCQKWVQQFGFTYGGYMEDRSYLWEGSYLKKGSAVHLGVDINVTIPSLKVHCPLNGKIIDIIYDCDQKGGWGGRIVIKTKNGLVLFAHLLIEPTLEVGDKIKSQQLIGWIADYNSNGGWYPHLHLQGLRDISQINKELDGYGSRDKGNEKNYPNPLKILELI